MKDHALTFLLHLRLPFQLALAPFFLLGSVLPGVAPTAAWVLAFVLVHVGLYGGATVYNSFYDQDEGPIGMLKCPPKVARPLRDAALALQLAAVAGLAWVAPLAGALGALLFVMGIAYSHPAWRFKGRTVQGLLLVSIGQGALAVLLGACATAPGWPGLRTWAVAGASSLLVAGTYPFTQIYQIDEDRRRGDMTLPVRVGWRATMVAAGTTSAAGLAALLASLSPVLPRLWPFGLALALAVMVGFLLSWGRRFEVLGPAGNHDRAMALSVGISLPIGGLLIKLLVERWVVL